MFCSVLSVDVQYTIAVGKPKVLRILLYLHQSTWC